MSATENALLELNQLGNRFDEISFLHMNAQDFGALLARIYGCVRNYRNSKAAYENSIDVLEKVCGLLHVIQRFHVARKITTSQAMVQTFEATVKQITEAVWADFSVNQAAFEEAEKVQLFLRAIKACGITPPGHTPPMFSPKGDGDKPVDKDALEFAAANLIEYTLFLHQGYRTGIAPLDPFSNNMSRPLYLYSKLRSLVPSHLMLANDCVENGGN